MPFTNKSCKFCKEPLKLVCKRDETRKNFCSHSCRQLWRYKNGEFKWLLKMQKLANTPEANAKKIHHKEKHPRWIKDRSLIKQKRLTTEEKWVFKKILIERNHTCELTGTKGKMSVHHIKPVWSHPESKFDPSNVIVITVKIHKDFHRKYGLKSCKSDWLCYINNLEYKKAA